MSTILFDPDSHTYSLDGQPLTSVTTVIKEVVPVFDKDAVSKKCAEKDGVTQEEILERWAESSLSALAKGSATHAYIEDLVQGRADPVVECINDLAEIRAFKKGWGRLESEFGAKIVKQEMMIGDAELGIAGTVDAIVLFRQPEQYFSIFDWKTGKKFESSNRFRKLLPPFDDLDDCHLNIYSLQTSLYRLMLERQGKTLRDSYLMHLRADGEPMGYRARDFRLRALNWLLGRKKVAA